MKLIGEYYYGNNIRYIGMKNNRFYGFSEKTLENMRSGINVVFNSTKEIVNYSPKRHSLKIYKTIWI